MTRWRGLLCLLGFQTVVFNTGTVAADEPGMTWQSLGSLPHLTGRQWVPDRAPANERAYLSTLKLPPFNPDTLMDAKEAIGELRAGAKPWPADTCAFDGMPRAAWYPYSLQFVYGAGAVMIQSHGVVRSVKLGDLTHASQLSNHDQLQGFDPYGDELGQWQGDTLVVDTIAVREDVDTFYGVGNDPDLHVFERYRLLDNGHLERVTTITAPAYLTAPWQIRTTFHARPEASWATHFCLPSASAAMQAGRGDVPSAERSPAPSNARFTRNLTWDGMLALPKLWGVSWLSTKDWDNTVVYIFRISLVPPLKPEYLQAYQAFLERAKQGKAEFKAGTCYPDGVPRSAWYSYPPTFTFRPGNSLLITSMGETREVFMDGRPHVAKPDWSDPATAYLGDSVGWWEGNTLVIDTVGFSPEHELFYDVPNGGSMHVIERYQLLDANRLRLDLRIEDPQRLTQPWTLQRTYYAPGSSPNTVSVTSGNGVRFDTERCRPGDGREQLDSSGNGTVDLTPPPRGLGIGKAPLAQH